MKVFKNKAAKRITLCLTVIAIVMVAGYGLKKTHRLYAGMIAFKEALIINNSVMAEMLVSQNHPSIDSLTHNVLCIGNSITLHAPLDKVNWFSLQGMAASKPECDYCHVLETMMRKHNPQTTVTPINLASWERDFTLNLDSLLSDCCAGKDIIVIRIGENVQDADVPLFENALSELIDYCLKYTSNVILTGEYWPMPAKEYAIVKNAHRHNLKYVPIDWIWNLYKEECSPKEGDTLYDTNGQPYQIKGNFITTHPNDKGMEMIARAIYNAISL